ncbi:MAG: AAA family ATPase [Acidobacteria bacterium]|nr:AAA family ATPase [Acidobacteriota bacterium]
MNFEQELEVFLRSRFPLVCIVSPEEERVLEAVTGVCRKGNRPLVSWDAADFLLPLLGSFSPALPPKDPVSLLEVVDKAEGNVVFVLPDFHQCWHNQPRVIRKLKNLARKLQYTRKTLLVTLTTACVPDELRDEAVIVEFPPPGPPELAGIIDKLRETPGVRITPDAPTRDRLVQAALGLSCRQALRVFSKALVLDGSLDEKDIELVTAEKKQVIRQSGALEFFTPAEAIGDVGGLEILKQWLRMRERAFSPEAAAYGLPAPKGIALIGIPGTGKSLTAKMIAHLWRLPLIRLDVGALFGSLVGQSEENARRALRLAETVAPCIVWIDELEKAFASGGLDGGTSLRVLGTFLTWMQEKTRPAFIVATANKVELLPPELLRRGRFDEIFFLDLPTDVERKEIFGVHIRKRRRNPDAFDLDQLARLSEGYVGAEIEQAVIDAMYLAFNDAASPAREFTSADIAAAIGRLVPLSISQRETVEYLRSWLTEGRAQSASFLEVEEARKRFVQIQIEPFSKN